MDFHCRAAKRVRGAAQARFLGAVDRADMMELAFVSLVAVDRVFGDLLDALAHGHVVVTSSDDQVGPGPLNRRHGPA